MKPKHDNQKRCMSCGILVRNAKYKSQCNRCGLYSIECDFCLKGTCPEMIKEQ